MLFRDVALEEEVRVELSCQVAVEEFVSFGLFPPYTPTIRPPPYLFNQVQIFFSNFLGQKNVPHRTPHSFSHRTFPQNSPHRTILRDFIFSCFWGETEIVPHRTPHRSLPPYFPTNLAPPYFDGRFFAILGPDFSRISGHKAGPTVRPTFFPTVLSLETRPTVLS